MSDLPLESFVLDAELEKEKGLFEAKVSIYNFTKLAERTSCPLEREFYKIWG